MEGKVCIFVSLCIRLFAVGQLTLHIQPNEVDVTKDNNVMIRCSMDILKRNTFVYSVMIKRRGTTCAVLFQDGNSEVSQNYVAIEYSVINKTYASLQLRLGNISCEDRGEYSCKMAVRRFYRNLQLGPVVSPLKVSGRSSGIFINFDPHKKLYTDEEIIQVTCSTLQRNKVTGWSWIFNNEIIDVSVDSCSYSEEDCLYRCSSTFHHLVSVKANGTMFVCGIEGMSTSKTLEVRNASISTVAARIETYSFMKYASVSVYNTNSSLVSFTRFYEDETIISIEKPNRKQNIFLIVIIPIIAVLLISLLLILKRYRRTPLKKAVSYTTGDEEEHDKTLLL